MPYSSDIQQAGGPSLAEKTGSRAKEREKIGSVPEVDN